MRIAAKHFLNSCLFTINQPVTKIRILTFPSFWEHCQVMQAYDPTKYWNTRENPNSEPDIRDLHARFLRPRLREAESVLELGPGVGRLMPLYQGRTIHTADLSRKYSGQLQSAASANQVKLVEAFIDRPEDALPFEDGAFDLGISFSVFLHVPLEHIRHSMKEMARVCKRVAVVVGANPEWRSIPNAHVFCHDYEALCEELGLRIMRKKRNGMVLMFVYETIPPE